MSAPTDVEARDGRPAPEHPTDDYRARSPLPVGMIEGLRRSIIWKMVGSGAGQDVAQIGSGGRHVLRMFPAARLGAIDVFQVLLVTARKDLAGDDARFIRSEADRIDSASSRLASASPLVSSRLPTPRQFAPAFAASSPVGRALPRRRRDDAANPGS